jgi:hypothetical protein
MSEPHNNGRSRLSLEQAQKQAKELLQQFRAGESAAFTRFEFAGTTGSSLAEAQFVIARELGFPTWADLKHNIEAEAARNSLDRYSRLAQDLVNACSGDEPALNRLHEVYGAGFTQSSQSYTPEILRGKVLDRLNQILPASVELVTLEYAQLFIARQHGYENWDKFAESVLVTYRAPGDALPLDSPFYKIDEKENAIEPAPVLNDRDWDSIFAVMKERGITALRAGGKMTDSALRRLCKLDHVTNLDLGGCLQLTDDGLASLAGLPRLRKLDLSGWKGSLTNRGLDVLKNLKELRDFQICWQQNVSDAGLMNLAHCHRLERVNVMGTPAGDGVIQAMAGKRALRNLRNGREVTDDGIPHLHQIPAFKTWLGEEARYELMGFDSTPNFLLLDGPFTDAGLARLRGLDGLSGLTFFWHCPEFTSKGLRPLADLPNLGFLGCQDQHCDDEAMEQIGAISNLRMLMGQGAVATDAGWSALSRSKTIEYIWGRECPNLQGRGFRALAAMPALRGLAVGCSKVDDASLASLREFPALRELVPMEVSDEGFRHVGACTKLEKLWCMYCRETGDIATSHLAGLPELVLYYAGASKITDLSMGMLAGLQSLERVELWQCLSLTTVGVAQLARLPKLQELVVDGSPGVTREVMSAFPRHVRVRHSM